MIRSILALSVAAALAACSVVPPSAYSFDPTHPQGKPVADPVQVAPLTNRIAAVQEQLNSLRAQIAQEPDALKRLPLYAQEHRIHRELGPLQRELAQYAFAH